MEQEPNEKLNLEEEIDEFAEELAEILVEQVLSDKNPPNKEG